ncbi:alpha-hydroxy acid oxidase [Pseudomonas sp. Bout1]|uniref:alpha-hydroxy acid oxidase n=2 Tax=Pseudomonas sp. Bout1 TaxID=3048600 RepID=UPI002B237AB0|nr:alpha-hydroxy acid oxidase [Pseudomonas sp. Bout1]MEB0184441.1 alpha-hydroxy acid oxidase [Pseudomonas sp. Bout1]
MSRLEDCFNVGDFAAAARRRLPAPLFHYIAGGADDELTLRANTEAFARYDLVPQYLHDIRKVDMRRSVFGCPLEWPLLLSPTGMTRVFHPAGELAVAREAARAGVAYSLSTMGTTSIEAVAQACSGPKIYQLYLLNDDGLNLHMIERCKAAGFDAICLTVDTIVAGNRERDLRHGLTVPPRLNLKNLWSFAQRPHWCLDYLVGGGISLPNVPTPDGGDLGTLAAFFAAKMEQNITWARVERLMQHWGKPFVIKGLQSVSDARNAAAAGVHGIIVSNHGGRQLDGTAATVDLVANIVDAVGDQLEVVLDGGVRRGSHIVKALAMGARACMLGRPYLYGLAAFGQPGVQRVLSLLRQETARTLALLGCANLDEINRQHITVAGKLPHFLAATDHPPLSTTLLRSVK